MPVSFVFATREEGHELLLTDVHVVIVCPVVGKLFEGVSEGPFLIANVPDGRYEVIASHEGRAQRIALTVAHDEPHRDLDLLVDRLHAARAAASAAATRAMTSCQSLKRA